MGRLLFVLLLCNLPGYAYLAPGDSLVMAGFTSRARLQMNRDANAGKVILDSLAAYLKQHDQNSFFAAEYNKLLGIYYYRISDYDSAVYYYEKAITVYKSMQNRLESAKVMVNISMVHHRRGEFESASDYAVEALRLFEAEGDRKGVGVSLNILGIVQHRQRRYDVALDYFKRYLSNAIAANDSVEVVSGLTNIGATYAELDDYDSAMVYHRLALALHQKKKNAYGVGNALQNIASAFDALGMTDSAIVYYGQAEHRYRLINNGAGVTEVQLNMGVLHNRIGEYKKAISYLEPALALSKFIQEDFLRRDAFKSLSTAYEKLGNTGKALYYYQRFHALSDSILDAETIKNVEEIRTRYETERKESEIVLKDAQLSEQQAMLGFNRLVIAALTLVLGLLLVIFVLIRNRQRRKQQMKERDRELTVREALIRASIQSQENERKRFAQDLHDGLGQLITFLRLSLSDITPESSAEQRLTFMDKADGLLGEMHKEIRSIAFNLMPQTLVQQGLVPALREMAERINQAGKVVVRVSSFDTPSRVAEVQEISLYRVIQEWVNNVLKYSDATVIEVQLVGHDDDIILTIEDNGNGFSTLRLETSPGNGWKNIRSRVNLLKGFIEIDSRDGRRGTTLMVRVPVHPMRKEMRKMEAGEGS